MRIGMFTDDYHPRVDGVVSYLDTMSSALEELGHEVYIICPKYPRYENSEGRVVRVASYDPMPLSKLTSRMMITNRRLMRTLEALNLDIAHSHTQSGSNIAAYEFARKYDKKMITTIHTNYHPLIDVYLGVSFTAALGGNFLALRYYHDLHALKSLLTLRFGLKKQITLWTESYIKSVLDSSDLLITNSQHTKKYVQSFGSNTDIKIVPNGVNRKIFSPKKLSKKPQNHLVRFALTSRISGEKRQLEIIRAAKELVDQDLKFHLTMLGDGPYRHKCEDLIRRLGLKKVVTLKGEIDPIEVRDELAKADVGILASDKFDTDPLSIKEYLAMGLPVIYCDDNFDDMFEHGGGIRCRNDYGSFAKEMKKIINDPKSLKNLGKSALRSSSKHDIKKHAKSLSAIYESLVSK